MRQSEVKELSTAELKEELSKTQKTYSDLKMAHVITPLENPLQIRKVRKSIARMATELTKRELQ